MQKYCTRVGNAGGRGECKDDRFIHKSLDVKEYLVKVKGLGCCSCRVRVSVSGVLFSVDMFVCVTC